MPNISEISSQFQHLAQYTLNKQIETPTEESVTRLQALRTFFLLIEGDSPTTLIEAKDQFKYLRTLLIDPKIEILMENTSQAVKSKLNSINGALILGGSAASGGILARKLLGKFNDPESDIDTGLLFNPSLEPSAEFRQELYEVLQNNFSSNEDRPYSQCNFHNVERYRVPNIESAERLTDFLINLDEDKLDSYCNLYNSYFLPSFPEDVNERNMNLFLEALSNLAKKAETSIDIKNKWNLIIKYMIKNWQSQMLPVKARYFTVTFSEQEKFMDEFDILEKNIQNIITIPFENILRSTAL